MVSRVYVHRSRSSSSFYSQESLSFFPSIGQVGQPFSYNLCLALTGRLFRTQSQFMFQHSQSNLLMLFSQHTCFFYKLSFLDFEYPHCSPEYTLLSRAQNSKNPQVKHAFLLSWFNSVRIALSSCSKFQTVEYHPGIIGLFSFSIYVYTFTFHSKLFLNISLSARINRIEDIESPCSLFLFRNIPHSFHFYSYFQLWI